MTSVLRSKESLTALLLVGLGLGTLWATADFPVGEPVAGDAALLPRLAAIGLLVCGIIIAVQALAASRSPASAATTTAEAVPSDPQPDVLAEGTVDTQATEATDGTEMTEKAGDGSSGRRVALMFAAALGVYSYSAFRIGFIVSTIAFIIAVGFILGRDRTPRAIIALSVYAVLVAGAAFLGFFELLNVRLPMTPLP